MRSTEWVVEAGPATTGIFAVSGQVTVTGRDTGGQTTLGEGEGSDVAAGNDPSPAKRWGQKRIDSVLARTSLP